MLHLHQRHGNPNRANSLWAVLCIKNPVQDHACQKCKAHPRQKPWVCRKLEVNGHWLISSGKLVWIWKEEAFLMCPTVLLPLPRWAQVLGSSCKTAEMGTCGVSEVLQRAEQGMRDGECRAECWLLAARAEGHCSQHQHHCCETPRAATWDDWCLGTRTVALVRSPTKQAAFHQLPWWVIPYIDPTVGLGPGYSRRGNKQRAAPAENRDPAGPGTCPGRSEVK